MGNAKHKQLHFFPPSIFQGECCTAFVYVTAGISPSHTNLMQTKEQTIVLLANPGTAPSNVNYHGSISMLQPHEMISKDEFSIVSAQP